MVNTGTQPRPSTPHYINSPPVNLAHPVCVNQIFLKIVMPRVVECTLWSTT